MQVRARGQELQPGQFLTQPARAGHPLSAQESQPRSQVRLPLSQEVLLGDHRRLQSITNREHPRNFSRECATLENTPFHIGYKQTLQSSNRGATAVARVLLHHVRQQRVLRRDGAQRDVHQHSMVR